MGKRILVVDDDAPTRDMMRFSLQKKGMEVDDAVDGVQALSRMRTTQYDLVVTDIQMPFVDGYQLLEAIRRSRPETKVILMSGDAGVPTQDPTALGAIDFLKKPFRISEFEAKVLRAMFVKSPTLAASATSARSDRSL